MLDLIKKEQKWEIAQQIRAYTPYCKSDQVENSLWLSHLKMILLETQNLDKIEVQWCAIEMQYLLHKSYVNEVNLNGQNLYQKSC